MAGNHNHPHPFRIMFVMVLYAAVMSFVLTYKSFDLSRTFTLFTVLLISQAVGMMILSNDFVIEIKRTKSEEEK